MRSTPAAIPRTVTMVGLGVFVFCAGAVTLLGGDGMKGRRG